MKMESVIEFSLASANSAASHQHGNQVIYKKFQDNFRRTSKHRIVPQNVLSEAVHFEDKYSLAARLSILACGTLLSWACVFSVARLLLN